MGGATPLFIASLHGHEESVRALVELGAEVDQAEVGCWDVAGLGGQRPLRVFSLLLRSHPESFTVAQGIYVQDILGMGKGLGGGVR